MKKIAVIIQARVGSTRLPGKVLAEIEGHPLLWHLVKRLQNSKFSPEIIIATTNSEEDLEILTLSERLNVESYAGSIDDVLDRVYQAALKFRIDIIIRITADCPLIDPEVFDKVLEFYLENDYDYVSNTHPPTYPDGLDVEICSFKVLERTWKEAKLASEREHVTYHIWNNNQKFKLGNIYYKEGFSEDLSALRWTVDEKEDLDFVREVFKNLYSKKKIFLLNDILELLKEKPDLMNINNQYERNEGLLKSLKDDKIVK
ncbi:MAG: cytidylyltransferase domain-containing protein [Promethearchaeota archaeon]